MSREGANPIWSLFDAAAHHSSIRLDCPRCNHVVVYHPAALWLQCQNEGRSDSIRALAGRYYCSWCKTHGGRKVRPRVSLCQTAPTVTLPLPTDLEWKQAIRRRR